MMRKGKERCSVEILVLLQVKSVFMLGIFNKTKGLLRIFFIFKMSLQQINILKLVTESHFQSAYRPMYNIENKGKINDF